MKPLYSLSFRTLIVSLIAVVMLIVIGLIIYTDRLLRRHEVDEATSVAVSTSESINNDQTQLLSSLEQLVRTISLLPAIQSHSKSDSEHLLSALVAANSKISNMLIADPKGGVWASARQIPAGLSVADTRHFKNAIASGSVSTGEYFDGRSQGQSTFSFAFPVKSGIDRITDVIIIAIPLDIYSTLNSKNIAAPVSSLLLVDHKGIILYSSEKMDLAGQLDMPEMFAKMRAAGDAGVFEATGNLGVQGYFSFRALRLKHEKTPYMYVRTGLGMNYVLINSYRQVGYTGSAVLVLLLLSFGMAWYAGKKGLFDKLLQLQVAADRVAHGDYSLRISDQVPSRELRGIVGAFDEISDNLSTTIRALQQSDAALKLSEKNYRELVDKAHTIILKMDRDGRITFFNEYAQSFFGFSEQELLGKSVVGTIVPKTESSGRDLKGMIAQLMATPSDFANSLNENIRKNGERVWISWCNHKLVDDEGKYQGVLSVGQDMTERKIMEEALRANELRFRSFIENVNDVIFVLTSSGTFSYVSPQWQKSFGYEISEVVGKPFAPFVHPDDVPGCVAFLADVLQSGEQKRGVEYRVLHKNGSWLWYTANGSRLIDQDGSVSLVGIGRDITEHKLVQKELMKTQKLESISFLAAGIAHNFNNVLTGVIGYISFARKHLKDFDKVAPLLEAAEKSSYRAAGLARQLLTFSKGGIPFKTLISPEKLVQESMSLFLSGSRIRGVVDNRTLQTVNVDSEQINQAFNNIVLNSVHAMPHGGTLTVHLEDIRLGKDNIYLLKSGDYVRITFEDCGCGIEEEHLHKVFDPYFTTRSDGTGLGLSTTQSIIAKHGGYIDIVSEVKEGTTVTVMLPSSLNAASDDAIETEPMGPTPDGISVLIMDDEEDIRTLTFEMLMDLGYQVQTCCSGEEAVELYKRCWEMGTALPVVVLDLLVPGGMGGCEAAKRILSIDPHARMIVSSGYSHDPIMADYKEYGFSAALSKPYNTDSLVQVIKSMEQIT